MWWMGGWEETIGTAPFRLSSGNIRCREILARGSLGGKRTLNNLQTLPRLGNNPTVGVRPLQQPSVPCALELGNTAVMRLTNHGAVPVYTISGSSTARPLPEWLARKRKRSLKNDVEYASRVELLQDFEFEEASQCIRVSEDGDWLMSTGALILYAYRPHCSAAPILSYAQADTRF